MEDIMNRIKHMKQDLVFIAEQHQMNFQHPEVLELSKKIDDLLLDLMKTQLRGRD